MHDDEDGNFFGINVTIPMTKKRTTQLERDLILARLVDPELPLAVERLNAHREFSASIRAWRAAGRIGEGPFRDSDYDGYEVARRAKAALAQMEEAGQAMPVLGPKLRGALRRWNAEMDRRDREVERDWKLGIEV